MTTPENHPTPSWPGPTGDMPQPPYAPPTPMGPPTAPMGASALSPVAPPPAAPNKSAWTKIGGLAGTALVIIVVVAVKFGGAALFNNIFGDSPADAPKTAFEGTPADAFAPGAAGIVLPAAKAVSGFTEEKVAAALAHVKEALVASRLSDEMLYEHDHTHLESLFAKPSAEEIRDLFADHDGALIATMIAPGFHLIDNGVRVKGAITFDDRLIDGIQTIEVKTNFIWVYAFSGELKAPGDHLVTVHDQHTWIFPDEQELDEADRGMYLWGEESQSLATGVDCGQPADLIALGKPVEGGGGDHDPNAAFDPSGSLEVDAESSC